MAEIRKYREIGESNEMYARIKINNATEVDQVCGGYMHSGTAGEDCLRVFHHDNGITIAVNQRNKASTIFKGDKTGWQPRRFKFVGKESDIEAIVEEMKSAGIKLEEIKE